MRTTRELAAIYNDALAVAGALLREMTEKGFLSERWEHCLTAQLNATLYTLAFALPPDTIQVAITDTGDTISVTQKALATPKGKTKG